MDNTPINQHLKNMSIMPQMLMFPFEAESVAYVVCQHYGIDTSDYSFAYVATWSADKEVPELKASLDTIRRTAADLIVKIDEKVQSRSVTQDIDKFIAEHGDELPFDIPESGQPAGFIKIEPPVDLTEFKADRKIELTMDEPKEASAEKVSVMEKLKAEKENSEKTKSPVKTPDKNLQAAI